MIMENYVKRQEEKQKEAVLNNYMQASLISYFVNLSFNGKQIPDIKELYPQLFYEDNPEADYNSMLLYKEQWIDFAKLHNSKIKEKELGE